MNEQNFVTVIKTQEELIAEAVANAAEGCEAFNAKLKQLFPNFLSKAYPRKILGDNVQIVFANVADKSECSSGILMNASGYMSFFMQLNGSQHTVARSFDIELQTWNGCRGVLTFRKIKGKTPAEALQKLAAWFEKNQEAIKAI